MERAKDSLFGAGFQVINIGLGEPKHAERYCGKFAPSFTCYAATSNDPYLAWGLRRPTGSEALATAIPLIGATLGAMARGMRQDEVTGDGAMQPGTFIVDSNGIVRYAYYSRHAGDDPYIEDLVKKAAAVR